MTGPILITGATGTVGKHVVDALQNHERTVRVGLRNPKEDSRKCSAIDDVVAFDFEKPETWGATLEGISGLFLVRPPRVPPKTIGRFAEAADRAGVDQIVYLSTLGAEKNIFVPHHRIERRIMATGADQTLLRASFFMQNLLEVHRTDILERGEIFVPAGTGKTSFVDARDIGVTAATVLTESGHENRAYDLTGPEALDYEAVASIFERVLDRPISYPEPSLLQFSSRLWQRGESPQFIALMCGIYTTARLGLASRVSPDINRVLDRSPRGMQSFVEDHADAFRIDPELGPSADR